MKPLIELRILTTLVKKKPPVLTKEQQYYQQYPLFRESRQSKLYPMFRVLGRIWGRVSTGITNIQDCFTDKYPTMQVFGESGTWDVIPLKKLTSGLIFVKIRGQVYPFILDGTKFKTYRYKSGKMLQTILYDIRDIRPFDPHELRIAMEYATKHGIKKWTVDGATAVLIAWQYLKDKKNGSKVYFEDVLKDGVEAPVIENIVKEKITEIGSDYLVKPTPYVAEVFERKLNDDPTLIKNGIIQLKNENWEWRKIANPAKTPFQGWVFLFMIIGIVATIGVVGYWANEEGMLDGSNNPLGDSVEDIDWLSLQNLGTPEELLGGFELDPLDVIPENQTVLLQPDSDEP